MHSTQIKTARDLRNNFAEIQRLLDEHDQVVITNNGRGAAVVIRFEDYAKYEAYLHERYIQAKLSEAEKSLDNPDTKYLSHREVWEMMEERLGGKLDR